MLPSGNHTFLAEYQYLSRFKIPYDPAANGFDRAAFRSSDIHAVFCYAVTKRPEAIRISCADQFLRRHKNQRICTLQSIHGPAQRLFDGWSGKAFLCYDVSDRFRITGCMENGARQLQRRAKLGRI